MSIEIEQVTVVDGALVEAFARLVPQLSATAVPPDAEALRRVVASDERVLLIAREEAGTIVGSLTLATYPTPTGVKAHVEDVMVDASARRQGVGGALTRAALDQASARGARHVDLTSRASRADAHRLYERVGFQRRETNVYRYALDQRGAP